MADAEADDGHPLGPFIGLRSALAIEAAVAAAVIGAVLLVRWGWQ